MAKGPIIAPPSTANKMVFRDPEGNVILDLDYYSDMVTVTQGGAVAQKTSVCVEGVDGTLLTMAILLAKPAVLLAVCAECRQPRRRWFLPQKPSHGILLAENSHACDGCHRRLCHLHSLLCSDGKWRCHSCAGKFRAKRFLTSIFFREERD